MFSIGALIGAGGRGSCWNCRDRRNDDRIHDRYEVPAAALDGHGMFSIGVGGRGSCCRDRIRNDVKLPKIFSSLPFEVKTFDFGINLPPFGIILFKSLTPDTLTLIDLPSHRTPTGRTEKTDPPHHCIHQSKLNIRIYDSIDHNSRLPQNSITKTPSNRKPSTVSTGQP